MSFQRLREHLASGTDVIHLDCPGGDERTLCGYAYEGSCFVGEGDSGVVPVERGKINCADCLRIVWRCKEIPKRILAEDERPIFHVDRS